MNSKKVYLLIGILLISGLLPQRNVSADMGPKPTMTFEFVQETQGETLKIISISFLVCEDRDCFRLKEDFSPDKEYLFCKDNTCDTGGMVALNEYFQLKAKFSDGMTRKSNVFTRDYFDANYKVTIQTDSLLVEELEGSNPSLLSNPLSVLFLSPLLIPIGCGIVIIGYIALVVISNNSRGTDQEEVTKPRIRKTVSPLFAVVILFVLFGLVLNAYTFILTLAIEGTLTFAYLKYMKVPGKKILYRILLANVFTQPLFVMATTIVAYKMASVTILEIIVWLVEAAIINNMQDKQFPLKNILALTFILNAASFGVGLLLPI